MIHSDKAVEKIEQDQLGRKNFAKRIAKDIISWKSKDNLVIGLYGKWGDGKTSVVNFIKDLFENPKKFGEKINESQIPTVIEFNPWIFSNQGTLIQKFLEEVAKELYQQNNEADKEIARKFELIRLYLEPASKVGKALESFIIRTLLLLPFFGVSIAIVANTLFFNNTAMVYAITFVLIVIVELLLFTEKATSYIESFYSKRAKLTKKTLNQIKDEIKEDLKKRERKILFIIDDVDRLTPNEVKTLFQLIKINLDLPNLIYLASMDADTVGKMLNDAGVVGSEYIEKIVQIPISLPKADEKKLSKFLFGQLDEILTFFSEDKWDRSRWNELYSAGFGKIFLKRGNLRIIKRAISQMAVTADLISDEVDSVDFLGIRAIEHFYPDLYNFIANNKEYFTTTNRHSDYKKTEIEIIKKDVEAELTKVEPYVKDVLLVLFPTLKYMVENYSYGDNIEKEWRQKRRICSENHFETYFYSDVPEGEMRSSEISSVILNLRDYEKIKKTLNKYSQNKDGKDIRKLLTTLLDHVSEFPKEEKQAVNIVTALLDYTDEISQIKSKVMFDFGPTIDLRRLIFFYLREFEDKNKIADIVKRAIKKTQSLYGAVKFVSLNDRRNRSGSKSFVSNSIIPENRIKEIEKITLNKIKSAEKNRTLKKNKNLLHILYIWREWGNPEEVEEFINKFKRTKKQLAEFLVYFKRVTTTEEIPKIAFSELKNFIDPELIKSKLGKEKLDKFTPEQQEVIKLFLKDWSHKDDLMY